MLCFRSHIFLFVIASFLVGSCGQIPRPFGQKHSKLSDALRQLDDVGGILIAPINGLPPNTSLVLTQAIIQQLNNIDIPASSSEDHRYGYTLRASVQPRKIGRDARQFNLDWKLVDEYGNLRGYLNVKNSLVAPYHNQSKIALLASTVVDEIAALLQTNISYQPLSDRPSKVAIGMVDGDHGDSTRSLPTALQAVLQKSGVNITNKLNTADIIIDVFINIEHSGSSRDLVTITWIFRDRQRRVVRRLKQRNHVARGSLKHQWGVQAYDIAVAMRDSIIEVLASLPRSEVVRKKYLVNKWIPSATLKQNEIYGRSNATTVENILRQLEKTQIHIPEGHFKP